MRRIGKSRERRVWPIFRLAEKILPIRRHGVIEGTFFGCRTRLARQWPSAMRLVGAQAARAIRVVRTFAQRNGRIHGCGALNDIVEIKHLYQNTGLV
jgi:hypothetical protein